MTDRLFLITPMVNKALGISWANCTPIQSHIRNYPADRYGWSSTPNVIELQLLVRKCFNVSGQFLQS